MELYLQNLAGVQIWQFLMGMQLASAEKHWIGPQGLLDSVT